LRAFLQNDNDDDMARKHLCLKEEVFLKIKVSCTSPAVQNIHGFRVFT